MTQRMASGMVPAPAQPAPWATPAMIASPCVLHIKGKSVVGSEYVSSQAASVHRTTAVHLASLPATTVADAFQPDFTVRRATNRALVVLWHLVAAKASAMAVRSAAVRALALLDSSVTRVKTPARAQLSSHHALDMVSATSPTAGVLASQTLALRAVQYPALVPKTTAHAMVMVCATMAPLVVESVNALWAMPVTTAAKSALAVSQALATGAERASEMQPAPATTMTFVATGPDYPAICVVRFGMASCATNSAPRSMEPNATPAVSAIRQPSPATAHSP